MDLNLGPQLSCRGKFNALDHFLSLENNQKLIYIFLDTSYEWSFINESGIFRATSPDFGFRISKMILYLCVCNLFLRKKITFSGTPNYSEGNVADGHEQVPQAEVGNEQVGDGVKAPSSR